MTAEPVHVTDVGGTARNIRGALQLLGSGARVIALPGNLSAGPIDPPSAEARRDWFKTVLHYDPDDDDREADGFEAEGFAAEGPWVEAMSASVHPIFWLCRASAREHASFLAFADRMAGRPFDIIDATALEIVTPRGVCTLGSLFAARPETIIASGLAGRQRPVSRAESDAARAAWSRLRTENAPLRVVRDGMLVSTPLTHFDAVLIEQAAPEWEVAAGLIGRTMSHLDTAAEPPGRSPGNVVLSGRLLALGEAGLLDVAGSGPGMRDYRVRAPATHPASG